MSTHYYTVEADLGIEGRTLWMPIVPTDGRHYQFPTKPQAVNFWYDLNNNHDHNIPLRIVEHREPDYR